MLGHKCYRLADKVCGRCQCNKKTCQDILVEGELPCLVPDCFLADALVVDLVAVSLHRDCPMVAPAKPPTQPKWVAAKGKGKAVLHPMIRPHACKVTRVTSPMLEVVKVVALTPVTGPSREDLPALFEAPVVLGGEGIGRGCCCDLS